MSEKRKLEVMTVNGVNEVITTTQEHAQELVNSFFDNGKKGLELFLHNCETLAELRATKGYLLLGYKSFYCEDGKADTPLLSALFGADNASDTEAKNMCLVATKFGVKQYDDDNNSLDRWVIGERDLKIMSQLSKGVLYELPALQESGEGTASIEDVLSQIGVLVEDDEQGNPIVKGKITVGALRDIKKLERQFKLPYNEAVVKKEELEEAARKVAEAKAQETETDTEPTEAQETDTEPTEAQETDTEPTETEKDNAIPLDEIPTTTLKEAKQLLKTGYIVTLTNIESNEVTRFIIQ